MDIGVLTVKAVRIVVGITTGVSLVAFDVGELMHPRDVIDNPMITVM